MLQGLTSSPRRVLMTLDAIGGVWRYAMDIGRTLGGQGVEFVFVVLGPRPSEEQRREAETIPNAKLLWLNKPPDWLATGEGDLDDLPKALSEIVEQYGIDLLHLNLPSQAHRLRAIRPVVAVSHSCVVSWWQAVKGGNNLPLEWHWQKKHNRGGFDAADVVLAPSRSHAALLNECYGPIERLKVISNATGCEPSRSPKGPFALAVGRWWDEGKNGEVLDAAARLTVWPVLMVGALMGPNGQRLELSHAKAKGERPHAEVQNLMARAGVVVSPSLYEPFGLVPLEAAKVGAALVLADISTYRELWDGAALFAHPDEPDAFAAAINKLAVNAQLRSRLGEAAALRAERFSLDAQADALLEAYRTAAAHHADRLATAG